MAIASTLNEGVRTYQISGQLFFASADRFMRYFDFQERVERVVIDVTHAHFWDITAVSALDKAVIAFRREGVDVDVRGMNEATRTLVDRFGVHDKPEEVEKLMSGH